MDSQKATDKIKTLEKALSSPSIDDEIGRPVAVPKGKSVSLDEETLEFFLHLMRTESLPEAAERANVSLSSANRMLAKLRDAWDDRLFVRSGAAMRPTTGARSRLPQVTGIVAGLESLRRPGAVSPLSIERTVRLAAFDNAFAIILAKNLDRLAKRLPGVLFQVSQADGNMFEDLVDDRLDMVFYARQGIHASLHSLPLLTTPYVCVVRKGHPLEQKCSKVGYLEREDLRGFRQVLVNAQPSRSRAPNSPANGWFNPATPKDVALIMPFFLGVPFAVAGTDFYSVMPEATAKMILDPEHFSALPFSPKAPTLTTRLGWHERTHADPVFQIIRSVLVEVMEHP